MLGELRGCLQYRDADRDAYSWRGHGGQQPISGSHVYMYAASTAAYGGQGIAPTSGVTGNASTSLLTAATGNPADTNGHFYVTTDTFGNFDINGAFACTSGQQVYLYSTGGDPQLAGTGVAGTPNPAVSLLAVVGDCASATPGAAFPNATSISMNEVSTVVAAYALAGFATDPLHIGAPSAVTGHALSGTGLANAFTMALNLANQASGAPNATLPLNSNAVVSVTTINTLADILAACVNSNGVGSSGCSTLFTNTNYGTMPADTATAAINIAQHPAANVSALLNLANNASPFQPIVTAANDLTLSINYNSSLPDPEGLAIDGAGNAWVINGKTKSVTEISSAGAVLSGTSGYTGGGLNNPEEIAIDPSGDAWVANQRGVAVTEISGNGSFLSGATGYTDPSGNLNQPDVIAIDGVGNAWAANFDQGFVTELSRTGTILNGYTIDNNLFNAQGIAIDGSGNIWLSNGFANAVTKTSSAGENLSGAGFTGGGLGDPDGIAIDSAGNAWVANIGTSVSKFSNTGTVLSGPNGFTGGGLNDTLQLAIDGSGNVWVANRAGNSVTELSNSGTFLSGSNGYTSTGLNQPFTIAVDGSGDVWVTNKTSMTEIVGVGTPVITPIAAGLPVIPTKNGSSNLGTRP